MNIIIDSRMRKPEKELLNKYGNLIELETQNSVYEEISSHPDIFLAKINNTIFKAPNLISDSNIINNLKSGKELVGNSYPNDVRYNICQIGNNIIHNFNYTDKTILEFIEENNLNKIHVKQGYCKCSTIATSNNSCITSDESIFKTLQNQNIDTLFFKDEIIRLLDKNGSESKMNGFIGGASCVINNFFVLFGDSNKLKQKNELLKHLQNHNLKLIDFPNLEIYDYGGIIIL